MRDTALPLLHKFLEGAPISRKKDILNFLSERADIREEVASALLEELVDDGIISIDEDQVTFIEPVRRIRRCTLDLFGYHIRIKIWRKVYRST